VQQIQRPPAFTARQALANQCHHHRHNRNMLVPAPKSSTQPGDLGLQKGKVVNGSARKLSKLSGANVTANQSAQNRHPNLPSLTPDAQLQVHGSPSPVLLSCRNNMISKLCCS